MDDEMGRGAPVDAQRVLNESLPAPAALRRADVRPFVEQRHVRARLVLESDGETWVHGVATRWMRLPVPHVRVMVTDVRVPGGGIWLDPRDVEDVGPTCTG